MKSQELNKFHIFFHKDNKLANFWVKKISAFIKSKFPAYKLDSKNPEVIIVLGGDGTILEAARKYHESGSMILALNLGHIGFLASVRKEEEFLKSLDKFLKGQYEVTEKMMITAKVKRRGKFIFKSEALNEVVVKSPLGMVELEAKISGHPVKYIQGTGILVSTATGSTAYNLSAHGPIVMPNIKCFIITEVLDHSIPSPSIVVKYNNSVNVKVISFRKRGIISHSKTGEKIDVLLIADGESLFPLEEKDEVVIENSPHMVKFVEFEPNYFFKSLQEKFGFR